MTKASRPGAETVVIRAPGGPEIAWRRQRLVSLGAEPSLAAEIADSDADVHDVERLLNAGCTLELAWEILQPLAPAPVVVDA